MKLALSLALLSVLLLSADALAQTAPAAPAPSAGRILVVLSAENRLTLRDGKVHPTGFFLSELAGPTQALRRAGYQLAFATPGGRAAVMDRSSDQDQYFPRPEERKAAREFVDQLDLGHPLSLQSLGEKELAGFAGLFIPGGHAPMEDLYQDKELGGASQIR